MNSVVRVNLLAIGAMMLAGAQDVVEKPKVKLRRVFLTVASVDTSIEFYRDFIGLGMGAKKSRMGEVISALYGAAGVAMDSASVKVPAGDSTLQFIEYLSDSRGGHMPELQDAGAVRLILTVKDLAAVTTRLEAAQVRVLIPGKAPGEPRVALARDPDGFFVELNEADAATSAKASGNMVGIRLGITVKDSEAALRMYREAFSCETQLGKWRAVDSNRRDVADTIGVEYRRSTAVVPRGNYNLEFLEFRNTGRVRAEMPRSLQQPGAANLELLVATSTFDQVVKMLQVHKSEFVVPGGPVAVISDRRSIIVRSPQHVFVEPRSNGEW